ncbi:hypothetical protein B7494_g5844 [Chlorociboria aeruginascens]|nr:hypothetical protein B7494_g5844 [Chlorociboria aeruginascens]
MFNYHNFEEVFNPESSYNDSAIKGIEGNRHILEGLFIDKALKMLGIKRPAKFYPPKSNEDIRTLQRVVIETTAADHQKLSILYYVLLDLEAPTGTRGYSTAFAENSFLPQKYQIFMTSLWHLDRLDFEIALQYLTHPILIPTFADEILEVLVRHSNQDNLTRVLEYYHSTEPALTNSNALEGLFSALARSNVTEAFYFARGQPEYARQHMFEMLISLVLNNSTNGTAADRSVELVNLPFTKEEESWFEGYLLRGEGRSIRKGKDAVMMRTIGTGNFAESLSIKGINGRVIGGLDWAALSGAIRNGLGPRQELNGMRYCEANPVAEFVDIPLGDTLEMRAYRDSRSVSQSVGPWLPYKCLANTGFKGPKGAASNTRAKIAYPVPTAFRPFNLQTTRTPGMLAINPDVTPAAQPYSLDKDSIRIDLTSELPQWILSAYGPGRQAPAQLFGGPVREQSFEEMRLLHYLGVASGNPQAAIERANGLVQASQQQIQTVLNDVHGAINFIINAENDHPNRIDICRENTGSGRGQNPNPFPAAPVTSNPFSTLNQPVTSAFGTTSLAAPTGVFGQTPNPFGPPSQLGVGGGFGRPSALGQKPNAFGAPSGGLASGMNNTPAPFSTFASNANPFAQQPQTSTAPNPNPFGAPLQGPIALNPLGTFGQPSVPDPNPIRSQNPPTQANTFGRPSGNPASMPFGAPSPISKTPFGAPNTQAPVQNPFRAPSTQPNPFGAPPPANPNVFVVPPPNSTANPLGNSSAPNATNINPFSRPSQPLHTVNGTSGNLAFTSSSDNPPLHTYITKGPNGLLVMFKGMPVRYKDDVPGILSRDGSWEKIWFPEGPPPPNDEVSMDDSVYDDETKAVYMNSKQTGSFQGGIMPMLPPKREWCRFDF